MIALDQEGARQVGFGLAFSGSRARPSFGIIFAQLVVLVVLALVVCKVSFSLVGSPI